MKLLIEEDFTLFNQHTFIVLYLNTIVVSSVRAYLTDKERVGYEVFFYTGLYTLYSQFFSNSTIVKSIVFLVFLGSLFIRYHLVVSDEETATSRLGRLTGNALMIGSVALLTHLFFRLFHQGLEAVSIPTGSVEILLCAVPLTVGILLLVNHPVFRSDEQRRQTFEQKADADGIDGLVARFGLRLQDEAERGNFDSEIDSALNAEELKNLQKMARTGDLSTKNIERAKELLKNSKEMSYAMTTALHALMSVTILVGTIAVLSIMWDIVSLDMLSLVIIVGGIYFSFTLLNVRFGLRKTVKRSLWKMPFEYSGCILVANVTLYNANLIGGGEIIAVVPFILYVGTPQGYKLSQKIMLWLSNRATESSDGWKQLVHQIEEKQA